MVEGRHVANEGESRQMVKGRCMVDKGKSGQMVSKNQFIFKD